MKYILKLIMSSAYFLPSSLSIIPFDSKEQCEIALTEAKKHWVTVNAESKCIDIDRENQIRELQSKIKVLKGNDK